MKIGLKVLVLVFLFSSPTVADEAEVLVWASVVTDLVTTEIALNNGAVEGNPLMQRRDVRLGVSFGSAALLQLLYRKNILPKQFLVTYSIVRFGMAGWNVGVIISF